MFDYWSISLSCSLPLSLATFSIFRGPFASIRRYVRLVQSINVFVFRYLTPPVSVCSTIQMSPQQAWSCNQLSTTVYKCLDIWISILLGRLHKCIHFDGSQNQGWCNITHHPRRATVTNGCIDVLKQHDRVTLNDAFAKVAATRSCMTNPPFLWFL